MTQLPDPNLDFAPPPAGPPAMSLSEARSVAEDYRLWYLHPEHPLHSSRRQLVRALAVLIDATG